MAEISEIINGLIKARPSIQQATVEKYFIPSLSFRHPLCTVPSFRGSRWVYLKVLQWYKIMSPRIESEIHSIAYDEKNLKLYVNMSQLFSVWLWPFHMGSANLTAMLDLTTDPGDWRSQGQGQKRYYVRRHEDLYQTCEIINFILPHVGHPFMIMMMGLATVVCVMGVFVLWPIMWAEDKQLLPERFVKGGNLACDMRKRVRELKKKP